jgi:hypothetical protein
MITELKFVIILFMCFYLEFESTAFIKTTLFSLLFEKWVGKEQRDLSVA